MLTKPSLAIVNLPFYLKMGVKHEPYLAPRDTGGMRERVSKNSECESE